MSILLIRHGETPSNAARVVQHPDAPLSPRGEAQAERLADRLAGQTVGRILSSDLRRAAQTAERLQAVTGAPLDWEPLLQERNFGEIRGTAYSELPDIFAADYEPPGGETWAAFHDRVDAAWLRVLALAETVDGRLAVVTHGLVCHSLLTRHLAHESGDSPGLRFDNASVTEVAATAPWRVTRLNCTEHLSRSGSPGEGGADTPHRGVV